MPLSPKQCLRKMRSSVLITQQQFVSLGLGGASAEAQWSNAANWHIFNDSTHENEAFNMHGSTFFSTFTV